MRAVLSCEPLTKRRPSGSSARDRHRACVVLEGAQDGAVVDVEELDGAVPRAGERVLVVGQRHEGVTARCAAREGVLEGAVEEPHADGVVVRAAEDALAVGHRRHRADAVGVPGAGAHEALAGDAPHLDGVVRRAADDVLAVGRHRHRVHRVGVPLEGVDERPVDVVQPDLALVGADAKADHKVHAVGQRRDGLTRRRNAHLEGALELAVERPQLRGLSIEPLTKRAPPGSTATA